MLKRDEKDNITTTSLTEEIDKLLDDNNNDNSDDFLLQEDNKKALGDTLTLEVDAPKGTTLEEAIATVAVNTNQDQEMVAPKKKGNLKKRLLVALAITVVYVAVVLVTLLLGGLWRIIFDVFVIGVSIIAALEMTKAVSKKFPKPMLPIIIVGIVLGFVAFYLVHFVFTNYNIFPNRYYSRRYTGGNTAFIFVIAVVFMIAIIYNMFSKRTSKNNVLATMFVLFYPVTISIYMLALSYLRPDVGSSLYEYGYNFANAGILLMFLIPAFADSGAFIVGSLIKGKKLAPRISPKKTISGAVGGVLSGVLAGGIVLILSLFVPALNIGRLSANPALNIVHFLVIGAIGAVFTILGDLLASYIKRQCEVKDFSNWLPGHGGILDRIDSMILCAVFLYIYMFILSFI